MPLILDDLDARVKAAVQKFWKAQHDALKAKQRSKKKNTEHCGALTGGRPLAAVVSTPDIPKI